MQTIGGAMFFLGLISLVGGFGINFKHGALIHLLEVFLTLIGVIVMVVFA